MLPQSSAHAKLVDLPDAIRCPSPADVFVCGPTGTGKTFWACAHGRHWGKRLLFMTASKAIIRYQSAMTGKDEFTAADWLETLASCELLILDDLGASNPDERSMAFLLEVLSERELACRPTIVTANVMLKQLDPRFQSRLAGYKVIVMTGPNKRLNRGGEIYEPKAEDTREVSEPDPTPAVARWLQLSTAQREEVVAAAKANDPTYWRSYQVPGRCVNIQDGYDRTDCKRFASNIAQLFAAAVGERQSA